MHQLTAYLALHGCIFMWPESPDRFRQLSGKSFCRWCFWNATACNFQRCNMVMHLIGWTCCCVMMAQSQTWTRTRTWQALDSIQVWKFINSHWKSHVPETDMSYSDDIWILHGCPSFWNYNAPLISILGLHIMLSRVVCRYFCTKSGNSCMKF